MQKLKEYIAGHKYTLLLLYWPFQILLYEVSRFFSTGGNIILYETALDYKIPFCEWFVLPYVLWYFYIAAVSLFSLREKREDFIRSQLLLIGCVLLPMLYCIFVPNGIPLSLRPNFEALGRENLLIDLVKFIYSVDSPPRNCMPSMHVSLSWGLFFVVLKSGQMKGKWKAKTFCGVLTVLISLSTVFIKQHSILDVYAGIGTAVFVLFVVLLAEKKLFSKK